MKRIFLASGGLLFSIALWAQEVGWRQVEPTPKFKPRYVGISADAGFVFGPSFGSAFYLAPKAGFQVAPRLFVNAGAGVIRYDLSLLPEQSRLPPRRTATSAYLFVEGVYLLNERWSINGSAVKDASPAPLCRTNPWRMPDEAVHFGVDCKITSHITIGARIGYSKGGHGGAYNPSYPY